jgi:hypothetical protein
MQLSSCSPKIFTILWNATFRQIQDKIQEDIFTNLQILIFLKLRLCLLQQKAYRVLDRGFFP